uniref:Sulfatase N-terminal domain-containing protein n=1 Tax=Plectus sambesii TaxID=2011161 RepID=A0A914V2Q0_9BILA
MLSALVSVIVVVLTVDAVRRPNILLIVADDHGWNDVDWHDPTLNTPNLNTLAHDEHTVQLDYAYVNQVCSPTRSALFSGYYPYHLGTQHYVFEWLEPSGVPLEYIFFPEKLKTLGYNTYMVGKWHLGYCKHEFLPTRRGFEKFRGYYGGSENYYTHEASQDEGEVTVRGLDYFQDTRQSFAADWSKTGLYSTEVFTNETITLLQNHDKKRPFFFYLAFQAVHSPLQMPPSRYMEEKCSKITRKNRQIYC